MTKKSVKIIVSKKDILETIKNKETINILGISYNINELAQRVDIERIAILLAFKTNIYIESYAGNNVLKTTSNTLQSSIKHIIKAIETESIDKSKLEESIVRYNNCKEMLLLMLEYEVELDPNEPSKLMNHKDKYNITVYKSAFYSNTKAEDLEKYEKAYDYWKGKMPAAGIEDLKLWTPEQMRENGNISRILEEAVKESEEHRKECIENLKNGERIVPCYIEYLKDLELDVKQAIIEANPELEQFKEELGIHEFQERVIDVKTVKGELLPEASEGIRNRRVWEKEKLLSEEPDTEWRNKVKSEERGTCIIS